MKHTLTDKDITILEHLVFVAEKSAKVIQFCFKKGIEQSYIVPKKDLLITFNLSTPITFDYPIANLKTFLGSASTELDLDKNDDDVNLLVLPTTQDIADFQSKIVQELDFTLDDLKTNQRLKEYKHLNIMGVNNKCVFRYQNHERSWWFDDGNKEVVNHGKCSRKFRYVIARDRLRLLPNDYKLILRDDVVQFQLSHLNYYFIPEVSWQRQSVKDWTDAYSMITDEHLIARYIKMGFMRPYKKVSVSIKHAKEKDFDKVKQIFYENRKLFPHIRNDYIRGMIRRGNVVLDNDVVIIYRKYKINRKLGDIQTHKGDYVLGQIVAILHES